MSEFERNLREAARHIERFGESVLGHAIGGEAVVGEGEVFDNITPIDGTVLNRVAGATVGEVAAAAEAAAGAARPWGHTPGAERRRILHDIADAIEERAEEIALIECVDTGQTIRFMKAAAVRGAQNFRFYADKAPEAENGLSLPDVHHVNYTMRAPIGPVGVITPWNTPFMLSTWKIAPALAAGCPVVHKPAEWSPLTATILTEVIQAAGVPEGTINLVHGVGEVAGKAVTEHPAIRAVAFVGESATGSAIQAQGAPTLKRVHFELGGKNPVIIFDDADLDRALDAAVFMIYSLNGERCTSSSRLLVQKSIYDEFTARVADRVRRIRVGHPLDPASEVGPLIHPRHLEKVCSYFDVARSEGAEIAVGGSVGDSDGLFVEPTLFTGASAGMRISQEEIFGPVLTAIPFDDEHHALEIANGVPYGLTAYLWTRDVGRAHRLARDVEAGMVWVNSQNVRHLPTPFGGTKASGIGRDGGDWSFDFYMETKNVSVAYDSHSIPELGTA